MDKLEKRLKELEQEFEDVKAELKELGQKQGEKQARLTELRGAYIELKKLVDAPVADKK